MQIHELNNFNGTPGATNFLAIDNGSDTARISGEALLDPVNSRIDNLTANVLPDSVETILDWADVESASKTLSKNVSEFDYLDLYFKEVTSGTNRIVFAQRYPRTAFPAQVTIPVIYWGGGTDPKYLYFQDLMIAISGTTLTMSQLRIYSWDGKAADGANIESGILVDQIRVDGVKISSNTSAELTDLRTAHNGTVYDSARAAREADYNALESQAGAYNQNSIDRDNDIKRNLQNGLDQMGSGLIIYTGFEWEVGTIQGGSDIYNAHTWRTKGYYKTSEVDYVETLLANQGGTVYYYTDNQGTYANAYTVFSSVAGANMKEPINKSYPYFRAVLGENTYSYLPDLNYLIFYKIAPFKETIDIIEPKTTELETEVDRIKAATVVETAQRDGVTLTTNPGKLIGRDGSIGDTSNQGFLVSDLVEIGDTADYLEITAGSGWNHLLYAFYDENENFISGLNSGSSTLYITAEHVDIPEGAKYVRLAKAPASGLGLMKVTIVYQPVAAATAKWQGKKWTVVGDSLTAINLTTNKRYFDYIAEVTGITVVNMGDSGSGYMNEQDQGTAFYQRILNVPTDSDVVTIFGSFNDGTTNLGTKDDTGTDTVGGCINKTIDNLYSVMPTVQLGIVSPTPWVAANPYNHPEANAYADLLEAICKKRSIPFLNLYYESNLRPWNAQFRELAYSKDGGNGVHPDETGHKIIASRFEGFLNSLLL